MDMYIRMFDDLKKQEDDNPTIGIIFCTDKDETMVKYSVLNESEQIFASKYMTVLPTVEELQNELERNQLLYSSENEEWVTTLFCIMNNNFNSLLHDSDNRKLIGQFVDNLQKYLDEL